MMQTKPAICTRGNTETAAQDTRPNGAKRRETIDETAAMVNAAGGTAIAVRVDHTLESKVRALFGRIARKDQRVDILVNSIAGEDPMMGQWGAHVRVVQGAPLFLETLRTFAWSSCHMR